MGRRGTNKLITDSSTSLVKNTHQKRHYMRNTMHNQVSTFFTAAEIPQELVKPLIGYVQVIRTSPKTSIKYFTEEEDARIPGWKLYQTVRLVPKYGKTFSLAVFQRILKCLDRRYPICLAVDDFVCRRYGKHAYYCDYFYSNAHGGIVWGNALVDVTIRNNQLTCPVTFEIHQRHGASKLWERGLHQIQRIVAQLRAAGVNPTRIWTLGDCTYGNAAMAIELKHVGGFYLLGVPKTRQVELFGRKTSLAQYFSSLPERSLTVVRRGYRYKLSTANLNGWGRRRLLAIHKSGDQWRYYACNKLNCQAKTLLLRHRDRWAVEEPHRSLKNYHGGEHFHVWRKQAVVGHFQLAYVSCALTSLERFNRRQQGHYCTQELLHREAIHHHRLTPPKGGKIM